MTTTSTGTRLLARNALLNLAGQLLPLVVALVAMPALVAGLDRDRFGILTLAWTAIGYFAVFDLSLGRALTHAVATRGARAHDEDDLAAVVWTTLALMLGLGAAGAVVLVAVAPWLVTSLLAVPDALHGEAVHAFWLLALALPFVVSTAGLRGLLEAHQRFGLINALRVPLALLTYLGPLAVLPFSHALVPVVGALVVGRALAWLAHVVACWREYPALRRRAAVRRDLVRPLLRMGGWMTVSNVVSPLMTYLDRFVIGAALSVAAVAYYVTPYEVVTKLLIVPGALLGVLFPAFAAASVGDRAATARLLDRGARVLVLAMLPPAALLVAIAPEGLHWWVGADFAREGARVLQWLALGVFVNAVAQVPYTALQGVGRPDLTAKLNLAELAPYLGAMWWLAHRWGITGVAVAWAARVTVDAAVLFALAGRHVAGGRAPRVVAAAVVLPAGALAAMMAVPTLASRLAALALLLAAFAAAAWRWLLAPEERAGLLGMVRAPVGSPAP